MQVVGLDRFDLLSPQEIDELSMYAKENHLRVRDLITHEYEWLLSDFKEHKWTIKNQKGDTATISFDGPLLSGGMISDNPLLIEDLKLIYVGLRTRKLKTAMSVEANKSGANFVSYLKRYVTEAMSVDGVYNPSQLTKNRFNEIIEGLAKKATYSQNYRERLSDYFDRTHLKDIPLKHHSKNKSHIHVTEICRQLGLSSDYLEQCTYTKQLLALKSMELVDYYEGVNIQGKYLESMFEENHRTMMHSDAYSTLLRSLTSASSMYRTHKELFNYNIVPYKIDSKEVIAALDFSEEDSLGGRTRDIPPLLFLKMMDASARFILDYAEDLFEAENYLKAAYTEAEANNTTNDPYEPGRITNEIARQYKRDDTRQHSPFPLAAYKHAQSRGGSKYDEILDDFIREDQEGVLSKVALCEKYGVHPTSVGTLRQMAAKPKQKTTGISLHKALYQFLPFCCTVVIMAFTARRESEVYGLKTGCIQRDGEGKLWLESYVAKTLQRDYHFSTVSIVEKAVKLLERLSENGRKITGTDSLFVFDDTFERKPTTMKSISRISEDFFDHIGVERDGEGKHWKLSEHQFRRFFAIMYFYRYSCSSSEALMHEFGHTDWAMTLRYLSQKQTAEAMAQLDKELKDISDQRIVDLAGRTDLGGAMFPKLKAMLASSLRNLEGGDSKKAVILRTKAIEKIKENSLVIDFIPTGMCFGNTPTLSAECNCIKDGKIMLHDASPSQCEGCPAQLTVPEIAAGEMRNLSRSDTGKSLILDSITKAA